MCQPLFIDRLPRQLVRVQPSPQLVQRNGFHETPELIHQTQRLGREGVYLVIKASLMLSEDPRAG